MQHSSNIATFYFGTLLGGLLMAVSVYASHDMTPPVVNVISPTTTSAGTSTAFSVDYADDIGVQSCTLVVDGTDRGSMTLFPSTSTGMTTSTRVTGTARLPFGFVSTGTASVFARCTDAEGHSATGSAVSIFIGAAAATSTGTGDTVAPSKPMNLQVLSISADARATIVWEAATDTVGVVGYDVRHDNGPFIPIGNTRTYVTEPLPNGRHDYSIRARDAAGNVSSANIVSFIINAAVVPPSPGASPKRPPFMLPQMAADAKLVLGGRDALLPSLERSSCELSEEQAHARMLVVLGPIQSSSTHAAVMQFIACGTVTTLHLGAGERLGAINSFRSAFARLPESEEDWNDVMKIGNGRFPSRAASGTVVSLARNRFRSVYLREPGNQTADANAIAILVYGLRPLPRNLASEAAALRIYRSVFGAMPSTAAQWDTLRTIAYSGATR